MVRLSEVMENHKYPLGLGLWIFGTVGIDYSGGNRGDSILEGLCPKRILLNDDWAEKLKTVQIESAKTPKTSYAYYPPEYIKSKKWSPSSTIFALCAIVYRLLTGELPYIGNVPEELLDSPKGLQFLSKERKKDLKLDGFSPKLRQFLCKGLMLKSSKRYKSLWDAADDFNDLCSEEHILDMPNSKISNQANNNELELYKMLTKISDSDFVLDVHQAEEGGLDDLFGLFDVKQYLRNRVLAVIKNPEKAKKYRLSIPNGLLLYGPTGCGKSAIAQKFAAECRVNYAIISSNTISSTLVHGTVILVHQLFEQAAIYAPIILIFDEIDSLTPNRNHPENVKLIEETNAFLKELDNCAEHGIFVIGTTNRPQFMDSAILRSGRFDKKVYVPLPDEQTRIGIFRKYLQDRPIDSHIDYLQLGKLTASGYISSDIKTICNEAASRAFNLDVVISQALIEQVIRENGPTVCKNEIRIYEESRRFMEPTAKCSPYINQIGFR